MVDSVDHTIREKLRLVEDSYRKAAVLKVHLDEVAEKIERQLDIAQNASAEASNAIDEYVANEDADDWLSLLEESGTNEMFALVERIREMLP